MLKIWPTFRAGFYLGDFHYIFPVNRQHFRGKRVLLHLFHHKKQVAKFVRNGLGNAGADAVSFPNFYQVVNVFRFYPMQESANSGFGDFAYIVVKR